LPTAAANVTTSVPGSPQVPEAVAVSPSLTVKVDPVASDTAGGRLRTTSWNEVEELAPSLSIAVTVTVWDWLGPSLAPKDQDQEPLAFLVTVPTEAASVTTSAPGSPQAPEATAVCPSLTATGVVDTVTPGGTLWTTSAKEV